MVEPGTERWKLLWQLLPLGSIILIAVLVYLVGLDAYFRFATLREHWASLADLVHRHYALSVLAFLGVVIAVTALSIPVEGLLALAGGFLFRQPWGTVYTVIASTLGATVIFLVVRTALGAAWRLRATAPFGAMREGFRKNAANYLLFIRFIPFSPFWLVNLIAAFFYVPLLTFVWTTFVGVIPSVFVHVQAGAGLEAVLSSGKEFSLSNVFNWQVRIALIGLALLAVLPVGVKKYLEWRKKRTPHD